jgi:hypothetical protein
MASDVEVEPLFARNGQLLANYIAVEAVPMQASNLQNFLQY